MSDTQIRDHAPDKEINLDLSSNGTNRVSLLKALLTLRFQDISIAFRVYISLGFSLLMFALAAGVIFYTSQSQQEGLSDENFALIQKIHAASHETIDALIDSGEKLTQAAGGQLAPGLGSELETLLKSMQSHRADLSASIAALPASRLKQALSQNDLQALDRYEKQLSSIIAAVQDNSAATVGRLIGSADIASALSSLQKVQENAARGVFAEGTGARAKLQYISLGMGIALMVLLVLTSLTFISLHRSLHVNTLRVLHALQKIARGDLTERVNLSNKDEIGNIGQLIDAFVDGTHTTLIRVAEDIEQMHAMVATNREIVETANGTVTEQQSRAQDVSAATSEMETAVEKVAEFAKSTLDEVKNCEQASETCRMTMSDNITTTHKLSDRLRASSEAIQAINGMGDEISKIVKTIADIADQTNLLALNATIEAARAGKYGRGFAIVAEETRELANKTAASTKEVTRTIGELKEAVSNSVEVMARCEGEMNNSLAQSSRANSSIEEIMGFIATISDMSEQIVASCNQQAASAGEINQSIENIRQLTQNSAERMQDIHSSMGKLDALADRQAGIVTQFKV